MTALCEAFGISRKTGYQTLSRYESEGAEGLRERSRAPHVHPNRVPRDVERQILVARRKHPTWGSKKILAWLQKREPDIGWPARSTIDEMFRRAGLSKPRRRRRSSKPTSTGLTSADGPNRVWCIDYKGWFRIGNEERCDPLTLTDLHSRYALHCRAMWSPKLEDVQKSLELVFREYGLPDVIRSDNGPPFGSTGIAGLTRLSVWLLILGVMPERIEPGKPQQNGAHERFHLTLKKETASPPKATRAAQQRCFNRFCREYNNERPHEALGMRTPAELYRKSKRPYPSKLREPKYPADFELRRIRENGSFKWRGKSVSLGEALRGQVIGLEPSNDATWLVHFGPITLGIFHEDSRVVISP
jgi:transposase InsO family protein